MSETLGNQTADTDNYDNPFDFSEYTQATEAGHETTSTSVPETDPFDFSGTWSEESRIIRDKYEDQKRADGIAAFDSAHDAMMNPKSETEIVGAREQIEEAYAVNSGSGPDNAEPKLGEVSGPHSPAKLEALSAIGLPEGVTQMNADGSEKLPPVMHDVSNGQPEPSFEDQNRGLTVHTLEEGKPTFGKRIGSFFKRKK